jgi:hypothetical protein
VQDRAGHQIFIEYQVLRLIEMDGEQILDAKPTGLIPFTPLMKRPENVSAEEWLRRCVQTADSIDVPNKPAYLGSLAVLSDLVYEPDTILNIILEETMHQASIIEYVGEKASQQTARESILEVLALRLQPNTAEIFKPTLDAIEDMERLKQLLRAAALADRIEDFTQALESNQD